MMNHLSDVLTHEHDHCDHSQRLDTAIGMQIQPNWIDRYFSQFCHFEHQLQ